MKIIIFILTTFVIFLLNSLLGLLAGFQIEPVFLCIIIYLVTKFFSDKWDSRKMCKSIMSSLPEKTSIEHSSLEMESHSAPKQKNLEKHNQSKIKLMFTKIKEHCRKHLCVYLSAILVIALAFSSFFAISFYLELKSAEKTIATYETEFSDALKMYKELKQASDQKMERRYELIHDKLHISQTSFENIKLAFSKQGNKDYTINQLQKYGFNRSVSRRIYTLWYEA